MRLTGEIIRSIGALVTRDSPKRQTERRQTEVTALYKIVNRDITDEQRKKHKDAIVKRVANTVFLPRMSPYASNVIISQSEFDTFQATSDRVATMPDSQVDQDLIEGAVVRLDQIIKQQSKKHP